MKGNDAMTQFDKISELLEKQDGMIQTVQVLKAGISKTTFYFYVKEKELEQIAHGIYVSKDAWVDAMYVLHLRCEQAVFSHDTALYFHDLTDREPLQYAITLKTGYNPSRLKQDGIQVYTIKKELHDVGIEMKKTSFGHEVPVYNMERTICDLVRNRKNIEIQTFQDAMKQYAKRKDKNLRTLMKYADLFHVDKILHQYLEVLL
jgi:predicted transcriptional regulator of viral defense system